MISLIDVAPEFWLTSGRYTKEFESKLAEYLGVKYCSLVYYDLSINLLCFMAFTYPLLGERRECPGDDYDLDTGRLEDALSERTKVLLLLQIEQLTDSGRA